MATKRKKISNKSSRKWFQNLPAKPLLALVVIAIFSLGGAILLGDSHAATYKPSPIAQTADYRSMAPYTKTGATVPFLVQETLDTSNQVANGQLVYHLPATSYLLKAGTEAENGVTTSFHFYPTKITNYHVCALVRRDKNAPGENMSILEVGNNGTTKFLSGSTAYQWVCTKDTAYGKNTTSGFTTNVRVSNLPSHFAMRVAKIVLVGGN